MLKRLNPATLNKVTEAHKFISTSKCFSSHLKENFPALTSLFPLSKIWNFTQNSGKVSCSFKYLSAQWQCRTQSANLMTVYSFETQLKMTLLSISSRSSVDRAPARCLGGHGLNTCWGLIFHIYYWAPNSPSLFTYQLTALLDSPNRKSLWRLQQNWADWNVCFQLSLNTQGSSESVA